VSDYEVGIAWGTRLVQSTSRRLRALGLDLSGHPTPEGPHFVYDGQELFLGRRGRGPLVVVWDTGLLIDYLEFGRPLWQGESLPTSVAGTYGEELEALQVIMALWVMRDIRFQILQRTLDDAKRVLADRHKHERVRALVEFTRALTLMESEDEGGRLPPLLLPTARVEELLLHVPAGGDRDLVRAAVVAGAHVFLTRDRGVLRSAERLRSAGLVVTSPGELLGLLAAAGALHCLMGARFAYWPFPDLDRVAHLVHALGIAA
jgi:hypothetical protein